MGRVEVRGRRRLLDDFFKVDEAEVSFERVDGSMTPPARRLVFERGDSVAAVVRHRDSDSLLFVEQFRYPTVGKGCGWLLELVAGMIDAGESPQTALCREIEEELGFALTRCEPIATFFVSPGGSSERIWLYYAEVSDAGRVGAGGGIAAEQEEIRIVRMSVAAAKEALRQGTLADAKTIIGVQWLAARPLP
ncbi:MAG: NUDIX hydrolase [Candidatus Accumulibacter sp.]|uniref:NUDIX hydrolase n=1 Tax=Accumulibacter sp. TaxID=2053492 RepID=UPI001A592AFE|nr:NUDIX hydrolase [Accumulibacter sp.]MBL8391633.1 NUDIX hydrolase [Accumulibacter sp.]HRD89066.1 NUDIX hydrolase [Accumulibacter sp.]